MAPRTTPRKEAETDADRFEMKPDGTAVLHVGGKSIRFRRPKFGEFRDLREKLYERDDEALRIQADLNEASKAIRGPVPAEGDDAVEQTVGDKTESALQLRAMMREADAKTIELNIGWVTEALTQLRTVEADEVPDANEWPPEMAESEFIKDLANHWRHRPLARGGGEPPTS